MIASKIESSVTNNLCKIAYMNWIEIGKRIKQARESKGLSTTAFGELVGRHKPEKRKVSHVTILNWENGSEIKKGNWDALVSAVESINKSFNEHWIINGSMDREHGKQSNDIDIESLISVATETYMDELVTIQKVSEKGELKPEHKEMIKFIADQYKDRF